MAGARLPAGTEVGRTPARQQLAEHRTAQARRHPPAGAGADRRAQRREPRSLPAVQRAADQRALPYDRRTAAGQPGRRREGDALSDVGRRAVRAPHRLRQRREPRAGPLARAPEGAGALRLALGAGRWRLSRGSSSSKTYCFALVSPCGGLLVGYAALQMLGALNLQKLPRGFEIRLDPVVVVYSLTIAAIIGVVLGVIPVLGAVPSNLNARCARKDARARAAAARARCAGRSSWRRSRSPSCCSSARGCCLRASAGCSPSIPVSTRTACSPRRSPSHESATRTTRLAAGVHG